jgi:hypothetical protein
MDTEWTTNGISGQSCADTAETPSLSTWAGEGSVGLSICDRRSPPHGGCPGARLFVYPQPQCPCSFDPFSRRVSTAISCRPHVSESRTRALVGHADATYASPLAHPVPDAPAPAPVPLLIGSPVLPDGAEPWHRAIPGGHHTVWLAPVSEA